MKIARIKSNMGCGLHRWAFISIMLLSAAYLTLAILASKTASSIDNEYAVSVFLISIMGAVQR